MRLLATRRVVARYNWDRLKVSFWFAPVFMSLVAILLSRLLIWIDVRVPNEVLQGSRLVLAGTASEQRTELINMATTILATAGVVFSLLTLPLSTVAAQYGSRLLRLFLGDRTTQFVLGVFVAAFVYCLAAATSIPASETLPEGYPLTATFGLVLMLVAFGSLVLLIQHISTMLQAPHIAASAGAELLDVVRESAGNAAGNALAGVSRGAPGQASPDALAETNGHPVQVLETGYIQYIDPEYMVSLVGQQNRLVHLLRRPGHFVTRGEIFALIRPAAGVDQELETQIRHAVQIGKQRTPTQDVECAINQLAEMALRAMSPAINDPFTAQTCLDYMGEGLARYVRQAEGSPWIYDRNGQLRLVFEPVTFDELLSAAFDQLRHCSCDNAAVLLHMLDVIDGIGRATQLPEQRQKLIRHVRLIQAESKAGSLIEQDQQHVEACGEALQARLKGAL